MPSAPNLTGPFYAAYKAANSSFGANTFRCAEETADELLKTATTSDNPGMLLGRVQSGKTRTFISILALAFDNDFDIAIVLSKNSRALIEQTAKRLNNEFKMFIDDGELEVYDIMHAPESFGAFELASKLLFVAKKQSDNLRRLIDLFSNSAIASKRTIIVDDEADNASIGYAKKSGLIEARKIALQISKLRSAILSSSFLQVTATPYSLYLQPTEVEVANVMTFKPTRPAFTKLVPVSADYVGGETYFGESARSETDTLESLIHHTVDHREFERLKKPDARSFKLDDVLTAKAIEGYRTALVNFIVGGCIQRLNGVKAGGKPKKLRYSFLLHSEAGKKAHDWQEKLTKSIVCKLEAAAKVNGADFVSLVTQAHTDFSRSLSLASQPIPTLDEVLIAVAGALRNQQDITITKVNSDDDVASLLDSIGQLKLRSPLNVFLGGQVLDRGVTLAGLLGFYYGRRPNKFQQDTVLQHSRMYGYRRTDLAVTRFYTSKAIRFAMKQMEEFDSSLRAAIDAGGDRAVQFIRKAEDGSIVPCSPNKILVATTQTLGPYKRILPIGFQTGYRTGAHGIGKIIEDIDSQIVDLCGFDSAAPKLVPVGTALHLLRQIEPTMDFAADDAPPFDWDGARAALAHLSQQHPKPAERGNVLLWAARDRNSARLASESSHATYIETPDSEKTEGQLAKQFAINHPILFLLRQNGSDAPDKGWRGTPFYWPVIRAQAQTPTAIYTAETID
ncbi:MAG: hypothetical protein LAO23_17470 [Acidobacteriia bacterium]|nr:hypothetical protein [Terriglobia bacterium]